jgi:peptide/nickel transport system ATP-binding protein/oligopeptide transport system ATP-binding protein
MTMTSPADPAPLLEIDSLRTYFFTRKALIKAVDGVDLRVGPGETVGVVGESGCGKTMTALSLLRLFPSPPGKIVEGRVLFEGKNLVELEPSEIRRIRGNRISMIFQEPMTSLNPVYTIGHQIMEPLILHQGLGRKDAKAKTVEMLRRVGIPSPDRRIHEFPHQLSGGMRQRVMIAMALSCQPRLLIADEPTTALDVTIQAQILDLMIKLKEEFDTAIMLITHNLGVVAQMAQRILVMYAGKVVEEAPVYELFDHPLHPYTQGLLSSIPKIEQIHFKGKVRLQEIPGLVPSLSRIPKGCSFHPRCNSAMALCREEPPRLFEAGERHLVRCWLREKGDE